MVIHDRHHLLGRARRRGNTLVTVLILTSFVFIVVGATLRTSLTERRINARHLLRHEARNASESLVEVGFAEAMGRFVRQPGLPTTEFLDRPLEVPNSVRTLFNGSYVVADRFEVEAGLVAPPRRVFIDPDDPANEFDPLQGRFSNIRAVAIISRATAERPGLAGSRVDAFSYQVLHMRDSPLFGAAIFYNMQLEFHPGPQMTISGPVHVNGDLFVSASTGIDFTSAVTAAGNIQWGKPPNVTGYPTQTGDINFRTRRGTNLSMWFPTGTAIDGNSSSGRNSTDSNWLDHRLQRLNPASGVVENRWRELSSQRWNGYVMDAAHGVTPYNVIGIDNYQWKDRRGSLSGRTDLENYGYALIEPVREVLPNTAGTTEIAQADEVRRNQFSANSGLLLRVELTNPSQPNNPASYRTRAFRLEPAEGTNSKPNEVEVPLPAGIVGAFDYGTGRIDATRNGQPDIYSESLRSGSSTSYDVNGGLFDPRQAQGTSGLNGGKMSVLALDVDRLRNRIHDNSGNARTADYWGEPASDQSTYNPSNHWNGVVYVEFPHQATSDRDDGVRLASNPRLSLMIVNGGKVTNPAWSNSVRGLTVATNTGMYVKGHFNADGNSSTGSATAIESNEPPAALAADAITLLSSAWGAEHRRKGRDAPSQRNASFTEVSAAMLTGITPSIAGTNNMSGGAHNFPRFIENWSGQTLRIRGSLVALFESELQRNPFIESIHSQWYSPPSRNWGFNDNFANNIMPPGTPNTRTFRRVAFSHLRNQQEYDTERARIRSTWQGLTTVGSASGTGGGG